MSLNNPSGLPTIRPEVKDILGYFPQIEIFLRDVYNNQGGGSFILTPYTVANLPEPEKHLYGMAYCTDETGGAIPVFSDGTDWRRVSDRAVAS